MEERENGEELDFEADEEGSRRRSRLPAAAVLLAVVAAAVIIVLLLKGSEDQSGIVVTEPPPVQESSPPDPMPEPPSLPVPEPEPPATEAEEAVPTAVVAESPPVEPLPGPAAEVPPGPVLPPLDESGALVEGLLTGCLGADVPARWLGGGNLIRLFVVIIDNMAEGASPRPHLGLIGFGGDFTVVEREGLPYVDPASYSRYGGIARIFASLDADFCSSAYRRVKPLVDEAYRDLGYPDQPFDSTLRKAIEKVLGVSFPQGDILLIKGEGAYHYEDPSFEGLSSLEKQVVRMGPENGRIVQSSLRALAAALNLE